MEIARALCEAMSMIETEERERMFPAPPSFPPDYTETEKIVHKMLIENTGAHILDSGSVYGRHWERNRAIDDFRKVPSHYMKVYEDEVFFYRHVFHFITEHLEYDKETDREFHKFANSEEFRRESWLTCMASFEIDGYEFQGITNTYNFKNVLNQVLQFAIFANERDYEHIVILQTHNGCDVRGGYSTPHAFRPIDDIDYFLIKMDDISATCEKCGASWYSDDAGYHWYGDDKFTDATDVWEFRPEENKIVHKKCGGTVTLY